MSSCESSKRKTGKADPVGKVSPDTIRPGMQNDSIRIVAPVPGTPRDGGKMSEEERKKKIERKRNAAKPKKDAQESGGGQ
jgi:hypothetical protein